VVLIKEISYIYGIYTAHIVALTNSNYSILNAYQNLRKYFFQLSRKYVKIIAKAENGPD